MQIATRDLRLLQTLAEARHFGRAAEQLGLAQPHLSARLRLIEERLDLPLFERRPKVRLTAAGAILLEAALRVEEDMQAALRHARGVAQGQVGALVVGFASTVMATALPGIFRRFQDAHPSIDLKLREMHSAEQWAALNAGVLDAGVSRGVEASRRVRTEPILREDLVAALPAGHPLAGRERVSIADLAPEPFVLFPRDVAPTLYAQVLAACVAGGAAPRVVQEADDWHTVLAFVREGFGVTIAPESLQQLSWPGLSWRALDSTVQTTLYLCWNEARPNPACAAFVDWVRREAAPA